MLKPPCKMVKASGVEREADILELESMMRNPVHLEAACTGESNNMQHEPDW